MPSVVIDASALLALWLGESGAENVITHVDGSAMSAVNVDEVAIKMLARDDRLENVAVNLRSMPSEIVPFDYGQALISASLKSHCQVNALRRTAIRALARLCSLPARDRIKEIDDWSLEIRENLREALALARSIGDRPGRAKALRLLAHLQKLNHRPTRKQKRTALRARCIELKLRADDAAHASRLVPN
ncbi:MAG: PIN domain-containing protein [Gemmataceae bacterium]